MKALGMIEVYGYLAAVEALDSALKAANVNLLDLTLVSGGLVTVLITGDVGAVKAAMDASKSAADRVGKVVSVHVIPRPSKEIEKIIPYHILNTSEPSNPTNEKVNITPLNSAVPQPETTIVIEPVEPVEPIQSNIITENAVGSKHVEKVGEETESGQTDITKIKPENMKSMTVEKLRSLAREIGITNMTRKQIRFATKNELIRSISEFIEQER